MTRSFQIFLFYKFNSAQENFSNLLTATLHECSPSSQHDTCKYLDSVKFYASEIPALLSRECLARVGVSNRKEKNDQFERKNVRLKEQRRKKDQKKELLPAFSSLACFCFNPLLLVGGDVLDVDSIISVLSSARLEFILARRRFSISGLLARFVSLPPSRTSFSTFIFYVKDLFHEESEDFSCH